MQTVSRGETFFDNTYSSMPQTKFVKLILLQNRAVPYGVLLCLPYGLASIKEFSFIPLTIKKCKHAIIKVFNYCICCPNLIYILELLIQLSLVAYRHISEN